MYRHFLEVISGSFLVYKKHSVYNRHVMHIFWMNEVKNPWFVYVYVKQRMCFYVVAIVTPMDSIIFNVKHK